MDHEILIWLDSDQDYLSGLSLFERYGRNTNLTRILRIGGATGKNRLTLSYELGKLAKNLSCPVPAAASEQPTGLPKILTEEKTKLSQPINIDQLKSEQKMIYKMLDNLHAVLPFREIQERKATAFQILDLDDQLREVTLAINHFEKTGMMLPPAVKQVQKSVADLDKAALIQRQMTVRTYVTRYKRLLAASKTLKSLSSNREHLEKFQLELNDIDRRLGK